MPMTHLGLVYPIGEFAVRAKRTSFQMRFPQSLPLLVLLGAVTGCQSAAHPLASDRSANVRPRSYSARSARQPDVSQVAFDELVTEAAELIAPATEAGPNTPTPMHDEVTAHAVGLFRLSDAESLALASHPEIAEARSRVDSVRGQYVQAGLPFNPVLQYQPDEVGNEGSSGLHTVSLSQQFVTANKLGIAQQVQAQEIEKQQAQLRAAELRVLTRVRASFAQALVAEHRVRLTGQIVELTNKSIASVESLLEAQEVSKVALLQARVEAEKARIVAENAQTQLEANRRALAAAVGSDSISFGQLEGEIDEALEPQPWDRLLDEITAASPEIAETGSELERARWALQLACAQVTPNVTGQLGMGVDTATDDTFATFGVSVPLPIRNRNEGNIRSARADIAAASAAIERTNLSLQSRLADAIGRYQIAHRQYERITSNVLPDAEETYRMSQVAFEAGETDYLQLLTAQRTLIGTQLRLLDSASQARQAVAEIEGLLVGSQP